MSNKIITVNPDFFSIRGSGRRSTKRNIINVPTENNLKIKGANLLTRGRNGMPRNATRNKLIELLREQSENRHKHMLDDTVPITARLDTMENKSALPTFLGGDSEFSRSLDYLDKVSAEVEPMTIPVSQQSTPSMSDYISKLSAATNGVVTPRDTITPRDISSYNKAIENVQNSALINKLNQFATTKEEEKKIEGVEKNQLENNEAYKIIPQRKRIKRTFRVGRDKNTVGVLLKNKHVRTRVSTDLKKLKNHKMNEVRSYLVKRGFIKVGSTAPDDVLRRMYEAIHSIGGEMRNHNADITISNYFSNNDGAQ